MAKAAAEMASRSIAPLIIAGRREISPDRTMPLTQQLDALWHFECVVSPRSPPTARPPSTPSTPQSPLSPKIPDSPRTPAPAGMQGEVAGLRGQVAAQCSPTSLSRFSQAGQSQQQVLQRVFRTFDENGDGSVSIREIASIFDRLGIPTSDSSIERLLSGRETKADGHVDEEEFWNLYDSVCCSVEQLDAAASQQCSSHDHADANADDDLLAAFHVFDKDGNGFISPSELQSVLCSLGFSQARQLDACVSMIARVDENGDGQIDFFEFKRLFHLDDPFMLPPIQTY